MAAGIYKTTIKSLPFVYRGKVRDSYAVGDDKLLIITTDRLSAFDVVMSQPIPDKGRVLNAMSNFWFERLAQVMGNHLTGIEPESVVAPDEVEQVRGRAVVAMRLKPVPVEAVVRGYLIGSGWKDYQRTGEVCGIELPRGLQMASKLPEPIFTPANKAELGTHDENISFDRMKQIVGAELAFRIRSVSLSLYQAAAEYAATRGIIIADTKFEFGFDSAGTLRLIDEVLTMLVTTPESLYLLLTSERGRALLKDVRTVIVDEIHAVARDKRGAHLSLSLERLEDLCQRRPQRIGLSATQNPVEEIARFLVGSARVGADGAPRCSVVDLGRRRPLDLAIEIPRDELREHVLWGLGPFLSPATRVWGSRATAAGFCASFGSRSRPEAIASQAESSRNTERLDLWRSFQQSRTVTVISQELNLDSRLKECNCLNRAIVTDWKTSAASSPDNLNFAVIDAISR